MSDWQPTDLMKQPTLDEVKEMLWEMITRLRTEAAEKIWPLHQRYVASGDDEERSQHYARQISEIQHLYWEAEQPIIRQLSSFYMLEPMPSIVLPLPSPPGTTP